MKASSGGVRSASMAMNEGHGNDGGEDGSGMTMPMQMTFYTGIEATILFPGWKTTTAGQYAGAVIAIVCAGMLAIYFKALRIKLDRWLHKMSVSAANRKPHPAMAAVCQGLMAVLSYSWDYLLMLVVMTFNVGLFLAAVFGLGIGVVLFGGAVANPDGRFFVSKISHGSLMAHGPQGYRPEPEQEQHTEFLVQSDYQSTMASGQLKYRPSPAIGNEGTPPRSENAPFNAIPYGNITQLDPACCET